MVDEDFPRKRKWNIAETSGEFGRLEQEDSMETKRKERVKEDMRRDT